MVTVRINTAGSRCLIKLNDSLHKVKIVRRFRNENSGWRNALIFLSLFEGTFKLLEKRAFLRMKLFLKRINTLNLLSLRIFY